MYYKVTDKESSETDFTTWASLMCQVYKYQHNGHWAVVFAMLSAFRSIIRKSQKCFPCLFIKGYSNSGRTQFGISLRSLFMHPNLPLFNLNTETDAAFFAALERYSKDDLVVFEEYNEYTITPSKNRGLMAVIYGDEGKQIRVNSRPSHRYLDLSKVNSSIVVIGQETPYKNESSLGSRSIICNFKKGLVYTDQEMMMYKELKQLQLNGLSHILSSILAKQDIVESYFTDIQHQIENELSCKCVENEIVKSPRLIYTVSFFLSMVKLWETHVPEMKLPFSYNEFEEIAMHQIRTRTNY